MDLGGKVTVQPFQPLKWYRQLATQKGRLAAQAFCVEGPRAITQLMRHHADAILEILTVDPLPPAFDAYPVRRLSRRQLDAIAGTKTPQGVVAIVRLPRELYSQTLPRQVGANVLLLEDIQDPGNVGALIRTADAFDFSGVLLTDKCADPMSPKVVQSTAGSVLSLWLRRTATYLDLVKALQQQGYVCIAADAHGSDPPSQLATASPLLLALGNEAAGLSPALLQLADRRVHVPMRATTESLNVAACGAICMYLRFVQNGRG
ncbi:23S rRNA (uridine(2479)-2'-O)-methyltransferase [Candidatus Entotheonellaceae bacterium PAL068K]